MKLSIIIPAHNEEGRIEKTLDAYVAFFEENYSEYELLVVLNGCRDNTLSIVAAKQAKFPVIRFIELKKSGKGRALKAGFKDTLTRDNALIGFVDADMATQPEYFYELLIHRDEYDGIIASRYMKESKIYPLRPMVKEWGRRLIYQPLVWLLFGMKFHDYQCGAKLFTREVIEKITPDITVTQWAIDTEILYLCKLYGFSIKEWPTVWYDQADSKLTMKAGSRMLTALIKLRWRHSWLYKKLY